ncbi:unnamed protein product [Brassicogethes aeneus]|uniref:Uncharacterized protein n=1 Tax=Brassicogethes aeneus TaxID=1431903 RepID=A0A9P0AWL8_BRAAE|nr:unnamed protein product [Brassicogethes aeneus]
MRGNASQFVHVLPAVVTPSIFYYKNYIHLNDLCKSSSTKMEFDKDPTLQEWTREQPLSVLALDSADRAVLRIADSLRTMLKQLLAKKGPFQKGLQD